MLRKLRAVRFFDRNAPVRRRFWPCFGRFWPKTAILGTFGPPKPCFSVFFQGTTEKRQFRPLFSILSARDFFCKTLFLCPVKRSRASFCCANSAKCDFWAQTRRCDSCFGRVLAVFEPKTAILGPTRRFLALLASEACCRRFATLFRALAHLRGRRRVHGPGPRCAHPPDTFSAAFARDFWLFRRV